MTRFAKRDELIVHEQEPFNAETDRASLISSVTATDAFYVRGHGAVPELDPDTWRLRVDGLVERELSLSLETLREAFVEQTLTATLQCAGNRRAGLVAVRIGAFLRVMPRRVYLQSGARVGARALGLDARQRSLPMDAFPAEFHRLVAWEVEDVLCIYKDELGRVVSRRATA